MADLDTLLLVFVVEFVSFWTNGDTFTMLLFETVPADTSTVDEVAVGGTDWLLIVPGSGHGGEES